MMKWIGVGAVIVVVVTSIVALVMLGRPDPAELSTFAERFQVYLTESERQKNMVSSPGSGNNYYRKQLLEMLEDMLTGEMEDDERFQMAIRAQKSLEEVRKEINVAASSTQPLSEMVANLEQEQAFIEAQSYKEQITSILTGIEQREVIVESIISTLYAINDQTNGIIQRIIFERGVLSEAHIVEINDETSDAETRYDRLTQLYKDLEQVDRHIEAQYRQLVGVE